jgi:uncharacterized repeat protein (TIGR01451 family)
MRILFLLFLLISAAFSGIAQVLPNYQLAEGQSAILKAHATDALTYIWFFNDEPINGEHSERLVVKQAGLYTVIALNDCCSSKVSDPVEIVINKDGPAVEVDMQISKQVDAHPVLVGDEFEYQLYIINNSPRSATDVKVIDKLPVSLTYERVFSSHEGNVRYLPDEHQVLWELDKGQGYRRWSYCQYSIGRSSRA